VSTVQKKPVIVALDFSDTQGTLDFVEQLDPKSCRVKIGFELFVSSGPDLVRNLIAQGFDVFLDLKFHDIPNTVAAACAAASKLGVWMLNVHTSGGRTMMEAAKQAVNKTQNRPKIIGVSVLTSFDDNDLKKIGVSHTVSEQAQALASLAKEAGLDGVVCSGQEASMLRKTLGEDFLLVTPGIRPAGYGSDDQKRIMDPAEAVKAGAHYLVIGRPITRASHPMGVLRAINDQIASMR
jgi:orotidine-5'-phosphate decarboxylase